MLSMLVHWFPFFIGHFPYIYMSPADDTHFMYVYTHTEYMYTHTNVEMYASLEFISTNVEMYDTHRIYVYTHNCRDVHTRNTCIHI